MDRDPVMLINGRTAGDTLEMYNDAAFESHCRTFSGKKKTVAMGVVYRGGVEGWFTLFHYDPRTSKLEAKNFGVLKGDISALEG
ncbi:hypothetical protein PoB_005576200 [Plakobranchus ocellatus]|uniref:Uncharacterized protein n=1 Tax=Plakobranchus ocellatus TaxID=259542 RepID=A0AAV4CD44_9GAST|nr:hypothetical protein PoB_005576200 [Plakobranchus ocellatus]